MTIVVSRRALLGTGMLAVTGLVTAACGKGENKEPAGKESTLKIGLSAPPANLDPAKIGGESLIYANLAYDPLIYRAPDGSHQPRLATAWRYTGSNNTGFEMTVRQGVVFSDGTKLDANTVKANLDYYRTTGGQAAPFLAAISGIEVTGEHDLRFTLAAPHPLLPAVLSQDYFAGAMISPAALASPAQLATRTAGAGPYLLDMANTAAGDHYTYVRNPKYWNVGDIHYEKVTIKVLPNENTALAALKTGQVDIITGSYATAPGAKSAGVQVAASPGICVGIQLNDRAGTLSKPLGDQRVRQALNFAVDREKITKALLGDYGIPTEQPAAPGGDGHNPSNFYRYDPAEAKRLLTDAGHPHGFSLPVLISPDPFSANVVQAIGAQLEQVGVKLELTQMDPAKGIAELAKYPASVMGWGVLPAYFMGRGLWLGSAVGMNPFHSSDPTLEELDKRAAAADEASRADLDRQIIRRVVELGWFLPVCLTPVFLFHRESINLGTQAGKPLPAPVSWRPA
jgi:peptide/nickel transport system substrate-binding protein